MAMKTVGSAVTQVKAAVAALPPRVVVTRYADGSADYKLYDSKGKLAASAKGAWDDATPWKGGTFNASVYKNKWLLDPNPDDGKRTLIELHGGNRPDDSEGCLVTTQAFLGAVRKMFGSSNFRIDVNNDYPFQISLSAPTSVREGSAIEITVNLSRSISKDLWVLVDIDPNSFAGASDFKLDTSNLTPLKVGDEIKYFVHLAERQTSAKVVFNTTPDKNIEGDEPARFTITNYIFANDIWDAKKTAIIENGHYYRDDHLLFLDPVRKSVDVMIREATLPLNESGSSGRHPFMLAVEQGETYRFEFEAYDIPDSLRIYDGSTVVYDTRGQVSGHRTGELTIAGNTGELTVVVEGNADSSTAWDLKFAVASTSVALTAQSLGAYRAGAEVAPIRAAAADDSIDGTIVMGSVHEWYYSGVAGHTYLVTVTPKDHALDPTMTILDFEGHVVGRFDDSLSSTAPFAFVSTDIDDLASLQVSGEDGTAGDYVVAITDVTGQRQDVLHVGASFAVIDETPRGQSETDDNLVVITRDGDLSRSLSVKWKIVPLSAGASSQDFTSKMSGKITFKPGEYFKVVAIDAKADKLAEGAEAFEFRLTKTGGAHLLPRMDGTPADRVGFSIIDDPVVAARKSGGFGSDTMEGTKLADKLQGSYGNDTLFGYQGNDKLDGQEDDDVLFGAEGKDTLKGGAGNDRLYGGADADRIVGGTGADILYGEAGKDIFAFTAAGDSGFGSAADVIADFVHGEDRIDLSRIDANPGKAGNQKFALAQLSISTDNSGALPVTTLFVDIDRDGVDDFSIRVQGVKTLYGSDFVL